MATILLTWFILSYGLMNIMVYGSIFQGLRDTIKSWGNNPFSPFQFLFNFIDGILSSGAVWAINAIVEYYEENRPK